LASKKVKLYFEPDGKRVEANAGEKILDVARIAGIFIESLCGGQGICGKCRVIVEKCAAGAPTEAELKHLSQKELEKKFRLACSCRVHGDCQILIPKESRGGRQRVVVEGVEAPFDLDPAISSLALKLSVPTLQRPMTDMDRVFEALIGNFGLRNVSIDYEVLKKLPDLLRTGGETVTAKIWRNSEIIDVRQGVEDGNYGLAVDIGTTKLGMQLVDLSSGKVLASVGMINPQVVFGEDIMTRASHVIERYETLEELRQAVLKGINELIDDCCRRAGVESSSILEATVVGNTVMHHIFLGICPKYLVMSPFVPAIKNPLNLKARQLGLKVSRSANVHILPVIAGFVGADAVADMLAVRLNRIEELSLLIDVGTNGEIMLGNKDRILAVSCAAGPAFEGAEIKYGMRATSGAIEKIAIEPETFEVSYRTVDNLDPRGICGSGLIDAVAEMFRTGIVDASGRIRDDLKTWRIRKGEEGAEFIVVPKRETKSGIDLSVTQKDIRELQLAKAAMYTGAYVLMKRMGVSAKDLDKVFIAGAFGTYIDKTKALMIGLFPDIALEKVSSVGNTALAGAKAALISKQARREAAEIAEKVDYVELTSDPDFPDEFIKAMALPHQELSRFASVKALLASTRIN